MIGDTATIHAVSQPLNYEKDFSLVGEKQF